MFGLFPHLQYLVSPFALLLGVLLIAAQKQEISMSLLLTLHWWTLYLIWYILIGLGKCRYLGGGGGLLFCPHYLEVFLP